MNISFILRPNRILCAKCLHKKKFDLENLKRRHNVVVLFVREKHFINLHLVKTETIIWSAISFFLKLENKMNLLLCHVVFYATV